jgi:hypothetical protein
MPLIRSLLMFAKMQDMDNEIHLDESVIKMSNSFFPIFALLDVLRHGRGRI